MPGLHATGTLGILSSSELNRDVAGVQGTYGWSTQSGAVTFTSGLQFAVAAIAAGDYTVNSVSGSLYAGGNITLSTQDPSLPRVDIIVITSAGAVSAVAGTPAAQTTSSGPVPPAPSASQLEIARIFVPATGTALSASSITDRRHPMSAAQAVALVGSSSAATSTTSTSAVDLVTISGLSILVTQAFRVEMNCRKQALAAREAAFGIKFNSTVVIEASVAAGITVSSNVNQAEDGMAVFSCQPRSAATYLAGFLSYSVWRVSATGVASVAAGFTGGGAAAMPNATITSVIIRGFNSVTSVAAEITSLRILTGIS